jgi:hypothetical protein
MIKEIFSSKEILYTIDLCKQDFSLQPNVRLLTEVDYHQWKPSAIPSNNFI